MIQPVLPSYMTISGPIPDNPHELRRGIVTISSPGRGKLVISHGFTPDAPYRLQAYWPNPEDDDAYGNVFAEHECEERGLIWLIDGYVVSLLSTPPGEDAA